MATAPIWTSAGRFSGIREFSQVTNSIGGYIISAGAAYNLTLPFMPDKVEWFNYAKYATNSNNIQGVWYRDMPAGDALIIARGTTTLTSTLEGTNGVTDASTAGGFTNEHLTITGATTATPCVMTTSAAHGLVDGDRVIPTQIIGTIGGELNNNTYVVDVLSSTTFGLYDVYGLPITTVGTYTSGGRLVKTGPRLGIVDAAPTVILTLGTAIMGASTDTIYFNAYKFNNYFNYGTAS